MDKPMNMPPVSLADISNLLDAKVDKTLAQLKKESAERNAEAAKRDAERDAEVAKRDAEAVKREAAMEAAVSGLREDMAKRETRLLQWNATIAAVGLVALGLWIELRDKSAVPPITVNTPPPVIYTAPPVAAQ